MHPTVQIGPADWLPAAMPVTVFQGRIDALAQAVPGCGLVVVYGSCADHAELAYLSGLTPKLDHAVALLPRGAPPALFLGGGPKMVEAARPLTWIGDMRPLRDLAAVLGAWRAANDAPAAVIGAGRMPPRLRETVFGALTPHVAAADDGALWNRMRIKDRWEIACIRHACSALSEGAAAIRDRARAGADACTALLAGERAAYAQGAQDVRSLLSLDGGRTLRPFASLADDARPTAFYLAVRAQGYWAEGFVMTAPDRAGMATACRHALDAALDQLKPGIAPGNAAPRLAPGKGAVTHPWAQPGAVTLGLLPGEPPGKALVPGMVVSLRAGLQDAGGGVVVSAMALITESGAECLWTLPEVAP